LQYASVVGARIVTPGNGSAPTRTTIALIQSHIIKPMPAPNEPSVASQCAKLPRCRDCCAEPPSQANAENTATGLIDGLPGLPGQPGGVVAGSGGGPSAARQGHATITGQSACFSTDLWQAAA
jgi:hypothetical protein